MNNKRQMSLQNCSIICVHSADTGPTTNTITCHITITCHQMPTKKQSWQVPHDYIVGGMSSFHSNHICAAAAGSTLVYNDVCKCGTIAFCLWASVNEKSGYLYLAYACVCLFVCVCMHDCSP